MNNYLNMMDKIIVVSDIERLFIIGLVQMNTTTDT